ncbi:unnamed protein product [Schistosoma turkestanicum]|nr:unnamed protein product [Schistosoma turkestanicum]
MWSPGDICIYQRENKVYDLFVIEEFSLENSLFTIRSHNYITSCHSSDLLNLAPENVELLHQNEKITSTLESIDCSYFAIKLNCLINLPSSTSTINSNSESQKNPVQSWNNGDLCICSWSEDAAYYYATILTADYENDIFTVSFCFYDNVEQKSSKDLYDINSGFEVYVKDIMNKSFAFSMKEKIVASQCKLEEEDFSGQLETYKSSVQDADVKELNEISSHLHKTSLNPLIYRNKKQESKVRNLCKSGLDELSVENISESMKQSRLLDASNIQQYISELQLHPLLLSWFICGYQTGFYEREHQHYDVCTFTSIPSTNENCSNLLLDRLLSLTISNNANNSDYSSYPSYHNNKNNNQWLHFHFINSIGYWNTFMNRTGDMNNSH